MNNVNLKFIKEIVSSYYNQGPLFRRTKDFMIIPYIWKHTIHEIQARHGTLNMAGISRGSPNRPRWLFIFSWLHVLIQSTEEIEYKNKILPA